jgi:two-component system cell cycle sensor histidine kinase/response regulator CckA
MLVLVVDDEPADCQSMAETLTREGFEVLKAGDAVTATRTLEHNPGVDLLVSDISLPGTNGCELARQLLKIQPDLRVLFVSGYVGAEVCRYYGVPVTDLYFLRKPFTPTELAARVQSVLQSNDRVHLNAPVSGVGGAAG